MRKRYRKTSERALAKELVKIAKKLVAKPVIDARTFNKANGTIEEIKHILDSEMPKGDFIFLGIDKNFVYFKVACRSSDTNSVQIRDIKEKTRFHVVEEKLEPFYLGEFKIRIM